MPDDKTCSSGPTGIDPRAKVCPHCGQLQHGKLRANALPIAILAIGAAGMVVIVALYSRLTRPAEEFSADRAALRVGESEIRFGKRQCPDHGHETVAVLGVLHNDSDIPWKRVVLEIAFYDEEKGLVDATQDDKYGLHVPARSTATFKVSRDREFPKERYASHKVRVLSAKDARSRF
ncbi:MAG: hypothetical protein ACYS9X_28155 [Planctomycetota bacterium]|jgi:hypothetical protein